MAISDIKVGMTDTGSVAGRRRGCRPRMTMENHQDGKSTDLVFAEWTLANGLREGDLTPSRRRRAR